MVDAGELSLRAETALAQTTLTEADQSYYRTQGQSFVEYLSTSRGREETKTTEWLKSTRVRKVVHKLQAAGCPYLEGMDEAVVSEVILVPGEARMRVLTWLTGRIHPTLQSALMDSTATISTAPRLASLLHDVGLCLAEDHELVMGTTPTPKQLLFLDALLDLVEMAAWKEKADTADSTLTDMIQSVPLNMERCCHFVDDLCRHEELGVVFPSSISLIPPGINAASGTMGIVSAIRGGAPGRTEGNDRTTPPPLSELVKKCEELRSLLEEKQQMLEAIMRKYPDCVDVDELTPEKMESYYKKLSVSLSTLAQLSVSFCQTYEAEIQPWTTRHAPPPSTLGPLCRRVHLLKTDIDQLFQALEQIETSLQKLRDMKHLDKQLDKDKVGMLAHQTLSNCLAVLTSK